MKRIKLIIKGILLWITILVVWFSICGIDSIADKGYFIFLSTVVLDTLLILACALLITEPELKIISGFNLCNRLFKIDEE